MESRPVGPPTAIHTIPRREAWLPLVRGAASTTGTGTIDALPHAILDIGSHLNAQVQRRG
jgi:hypothetical protein